ncbi:hypothetical protein EWM64_g7995 [Hericium alpestre]|uniref:Uncharacterized protein n=1 Tax=Hericium alpestre TaxID=135208 RepID=A0A4Y9ZR85_9AGAM|nr:hypothetical protein EWM64_g7995 [Hericium alpestre]
MSSPEKVCKPAPRQMYRLVQTVDDNNTRWFEVYVSHFSVRSNPKKINPQQKCDLVGRFPLHYFHVVRFLLKIINDCIWHRVALEEEKKAKRVESNIADTYLANMDAQFLFHSNLLELVLKQISEDPSARLPLLDAWALVQYWGRGFLVNDTKWPKLKALKELGDPLNFENLENWYNWTAWAQREERC